MLMIALRPIMGIGLCCFLCCCTHLKPAIQGNDCIDKIVNAIEAAPEESVVCTLDGQFVALDEFFDLCDKNNPICSLYRKFYLWQSEVITADSPARAGRVRHRIRVYYNPSSICHPERVHPGRIYGDVAEFYDMDGEFMGMAVYMGEGAYFPLPFSRYTSKKTGPLFPGIVM